MKHRISISVPLFAFLVLGVGIETPAQADERPARFELRAFAGLHIFHRNSELGASEHLRPGEMDDLRIETIAYPGLAALVGVAVAYRISGIVHAEAWLAPASATIRHNGARATILLYGAQVTGRWQLGRVEPFVALGVGAQSLLSPVHAPEMAPERALQAERDETAHVSAGMSYDMGGWGLRFEGIAWAVPTRRHPWSVVPEVSIHAGAFVRFGGRGTAAADIDRDGLRGSADKCPAEPEDVDGFEDADGCPDLDNDADTIADASDACPNEPEDLDGFDDTDGCPDTDNDRDGLADAIDACPMTAEDRDGYQDDDGCPDLDNDGDTIADADDKCPMSAETKNDFRDSDGCPDEIPQAFASYIGVIPGIQFERDSADIRPRSKRLLDQAAEVLRGHPDVRLIIEGHADYTGTAEYNLELSQRRAEAVKGYLVSKGIAAERLTAIGFGNRLPMAPNTTEDGRQKNRRVVFRME